MKQFVLRVLCGAAIGVGFVLPGVSGGIIAVSMGLYEKMLAAIRRFFSDIKGNFMFLLPIGLGGVIGVLLTSNVLKLVIEEHQSEVMALFCGFVLGSLPTLYEETRRDPLVTVKTPVRRRDAVAAAAGLLFVLLFYFLDTSATRDAAMSASIPPFYAIIGGMVLALGVAIPGLSSSFLLVYLGMYKAIMYAIAEINIPTLFFTGVGFAISGLLLIIGMNYLLKRFHRISYFAILGIAVGSMILIVPDVMKGFTLLCIPLFLLGTGLGVLQSVIQIRRARRNAQKDSAADVGTTPALETETRV